ncbi:MAG: tetratricopeptide repeat protein [Nitrospirota bacterium]|nr:tetratricopeptide repeat protein [Nitrospirota bacterium]
MRGFKIAFGIGVVLLVSSTMSSLAWGQVLMPLSGTQGAESINGGVNHYHQRNWNSAVSQFQQALKKNPNSAVAHYNLGLTLRQMGQQDKAVQHFRKASQFGRSNLFIRNSSEVKKSLEQKMR